MKRYNLSGPPGSDMKEHDNGEWVRYQDIQEDIGQRKKVRKMKDQLWKVREALYEIIQGTHITAIGCGECYADDYEDWIEE